MGNARYECPNCGHSLDEVTAQNEVLERRNKYLSRQLRESEGELEQLDHRYYMASDQRLTFHKPHCNWAKYLENSLHCIEFSSHSEAKEADYRPCKTCCA